MGENIASERIQTNAPNCFSVRAGNFQDIGKRSEQQDSFGCSNFTDIELTKVGGYTGVVCDGMGGLVGGREASSKAVETFLEKQTQYSLANLSPSESLLRAAQSTNDAVARLAENMNESGNCGTTLVAVTIHNGKLYWISVGDSHIYLIRNGHMTQLNKEHIYANKLQIAVDRGVITEEDALRDPQREALTSFIGIETLTEIDRGQIPLYSGDSVLLCSDGLYKTLKDYEIAEQFDANPQEWTEKLIRTTLAKDNPHQDNVTAVVLTISWTKKESEAKQKDKTVMLNVYKAEKTGPFTHRDLSKKLLIGTVVFMLMCVFAIGIAKLYYGRCVTKSTPDALISVQNTDKTKAGATLSEQVKSAGDNAGDNKENPELTVPNKKTQCPDILADSADEKLETEYSQKKPTCFVKIIGGLITLAVVGLLILSVKSGLLNLCSKKRKH